MQRNGVIDRLYVLDGGLALVQDRSIYTPGKWQGEPITLSCNAYLIRHAGRWIMWDTGIEDAVAETPGGRIIAHGIRGVVTRPIRAQLGALGIAPEDISKVILSHGHFDHIGNAGLFRRAEWHIQRREHQAMSGPDFEQHGYSPALYESLKHAAITLMDGDADIFGDGSMRVISTPGHTPGHCSLLVQLADTGPVLLSGDVAHFRYSMEHRCVPDMNYSPAESLASMERVAAIVREEKAQLWLNHDIAQSATIPHAPAFFA